MSRGKLTTPAIPNLNEKMVWTEHLKVATLAPAGLRSRGVKPLPLSDNLSKHTYLSPFWNYRLLRWFSMVKNDETSSVLLGKKTA
jgi:hypothetical protein